MNSAEARAAAEYLLERALDEVRSDDDAIGSVSAALAALRIEVGELAGDELDGYPLGALSDESAARCTCPPDLAARGGFTSTCLSAAHG